MAEPFQDMKVLVVGGAGFVGSNLVKVLLSHKPSRIDVIDNLLSAERFNVPDHDSVRFIEGSIADDSILTCLQDEYDYLFHLSTYHGNQSSICNPLADHENNLLTTLKLLEQVKSFKKIKKIVYSGAGCAVAEKTFDKVHATQEDAPVSLHMDSPYSISKIVGEFYMLYYFNQHGLPAVRARFQNVYGPGEILGAGQWRGTPATVWRNVTPTFVYKALKKMPLPIENEGIATRDFIYVNDICRGLIACALKGKPGDVYNLASGQETTILELARTINQLTDNPAGLEYLPKRPWDNSGRRFGSTAKAKDQIGFRSEVPLEKGLGLTIDWTRKNLQQIELCMAKHEKYLPH